jgi:hypothetical protein
MDISKKVEMTIDRREAICRVTALFGTVALAGTTDLFTTIEKAHARATVSRLQVGTFSAQDIALLDEVADTILPETKTPGAKAAHVGAFMALMVTDTYEERHQTIFRDGMKKINDASFMTATPAQRLARLEELDREQKAYMDARDPGAPPHFFRLMKELTLLGYFTSEIGYTQAMRYLETPRSFEPCVPYTPGETSWAAHA